MSKSKRYGTLKQEETARKEVQNFLNILDERGVAIIEPIGTREILQEIASETPSISRTELAEEFIRRTSETPCEDGAPGLWLAHEGTPFCIPFTKRFTKRFRKHL